MKILRLHRAVSACTRAALAAIAAVTCVSQPPAEDAECAAPSVETTGWVERGGQAFTIQLPPTFTVQPARGIDSEVGRWSDGTSQLDYDYGVYSNDLSTIGQPGERQVCEVSIGGRPARVVVARTADGQYLAAAHWAGLGTNAMGTVALTMLGTAADAQAQRTLLASLWSVRFRD